ncbi:MAG: hypothetical protein P9E24_05085 [Candidatus Competibacter sp.]|nr:hypothetical protein [Candidatus Competibacter sp.]MDG4584297.1 hypothetical protein [Candidatus Competibacter sp.]
MADRNLVLQLLITAKDAASGVFATVFRALNDSTNVIATHVREAFSNLFGGTVDSAAVFEQQLSNVQPGRVDAVHLSYPRRDRHGGPCPPYRPQIQAARSRHVFGVG